MHKECGIGLFYSATEECHGWQDSVGGDHNMESYGLTKRTVPNE